MITAEIPSVRDMIRKVPYAKQARRLLTRLITFSIAVGDKVSFAAHEAKREAMMRVSAFRSERMSDWWEKRHSDRTRNGYWIADSDPDYVWRTLRISDRIVLGATVLEIGVGTGRNMRELVERGCRVYGLDISQRALMDVSDIAEKCWHVSDLHSLPPNCFDLVCSFLVSQHMDNESLAAQMRAVIRSLKSDGVFAIQYAQPIDGMERDHRSIEVQQRAGTVTRTQAEMERLVRDSGGVIMHEHTEGHWPHYRLQWGIIHVRKL